MTRTLQFKRSLAILRIQRKLEDESFPRIQMALIVALTGAFGLVASFALLRAGIDGMALRYPLALVGAYLFFLFLLWLWLRTKLDEYVDLPDISGLVPDRSAGDATLPFQTGGGGDFGGGGASASFDAPTSLEATGAGSESSIAEAAGAVDLDELAIPIVAIALAVGLALASLYVIYVAPILFAELLVDGAISYVLYRRLRSADTGHWLETALRRTALPFGLTAIFLALVGAAMSAYAPGTRSVGEVLLYATTSRHQ